MNKTTRLEFAKVIGMLAISIGKPIHDDPVKASERTDVYFKMLGDLPLDALQAAAERLVCERQWPTFPQIAEIRKLAAEIKTKNDALPSAGEAWDLAIKTALKMCRPGLDFVNGLARDEWNGRCLSELPAVVSRTLFTFGFERIQDMPSDQVGTAFAQFRGVYEACIAKEQERRLLPIGLQRRIDAVAEQQVPKLPPTVAAALNAIGTIPTVKA